MRLLGAERWWPDMSLPVGVAMVAALGIGPLIAWALVEESRLLLAVGVLAALAPIALRWPITVAFGAYAFVLPFDSVAYIAETGGPTVTRALGIGAAGVLLAAGVVQRRLVRPPLAAVWVMLLFLWAMISLSWALEPELARGRITTAVSLVAMYLAAVSFRVSEKELKTVCVVAMIGGAVAAIAGVVMGFEADAPRVARGTLAVAGREANPNGVAQALLLPLAMAIGLFLSSEKVWARLVAVAGIGAIAAGIFLTMSRASLAAVAMMMCVFLYRFRVRWQVLAVVGTLIAILPFMPDLFFERIGSLFTGEDTTGSGRTDIWAVYVQALERFGWFGAGLSNFPAAYDLYAYTPPGSPSRAPHNTYLGLWVELGAVGLVLLLTVLFAHLRLGGQRVRRVPDVAFHAAIEAACVGFLVIALFGDALWRKTIWMPWILIVWASRIRADSPAVEPGRT